MSDASSLNPAQRDVVALLGKPAEPVVFAGELRDELRDYVESELGPLSDNLDPDHPLWVSKHALTGVHGCEAMYQASEGGFSWNPATTRGAVAHKAIELTLGWPGEPLPLELVQESVERLAERDDGMARFLQGMSAGDRAELVGEANDLVAKFLECFPPLRAAWKPVAESRSVVEVLGRRVVLSGKVDLTLGVSRPEAANKVIIDLKSGSPVASHRDDLRFYALLETLKLGVPPRMLASYYLDSATAHPERVTADLLWAAARRTVDGTRAIIELNEGREPLKRPGPPCRWCPLSTDCPEGRSFLDDER